MKMDVQKLTAQKAGSIELPDDIFGLDPRADLLHRMVVWQLAKRRAGTHKTKTRGEVNRTGAKWGRQKGLGRARHGSRKSGIFVGGGKAHGPKPRSHAIGLPKKMRALALKYALSAKVKDGSLVVLESTEVAKPKTKAVKEALHKLGLENALIIDGREVDENFARAARNIPNIDVLPVQGINVYDILRRDKLALTKAAVEALQERFQ